MKKGEESVEMAPIKSASKRSNAIESRLKAREKEKENPFDKFANSRKKHGKNVFFFNFTWLVCWFSWRYPATGTHQPTH